jgi:hypothetical protein
MKMADAKEDRAAAARAAREHYLDLTTQITEIMRPIEEEGRRLTPSEAKRVFDLIKPQAAALQAWVDASR